MAIDLGSIMSVAGSLKAAGDIAKTMIGLRDETTFQLKAAELVGVIMTAQGHALTAQGEQSTLLQEKRALEDKLMEFNDWKREAERYALKDFGGQVYAYALKPGMEQGEPAHYLCVNCYSKRQKSILQCLTTDGYFECHNCSKGFQLGERNTRVTFAVGGRDDGWMGAE
jgi:hypothetical protein